MSIERSDFIKWTELAESTRIKLIKTEDNTMNEENLKEMSEQSLISTKFSKTGENVNIMEVCSGNLNHVNLKQVKKKIHISDFYKILRYIIRI